MKTLFTFFMYLNLFVVCFYSIGLGIALYTHGIEEIDMMSIAIIPLSLLFYFLFRYRLKKLNEQSPQEKAVHSHKKRKRK